MSAAELGAARPGTLASLLALYRLLLRSQISVQRLLGIGALGALAIVIGAFARADANQSQAAADLVSSYGFGLLVPLAALWLGTSTIGDLVEDRLLVYLWLKPVPRWQLPAAAVLATVTVVAPLSVRPSGSTAGGMMRSRSA
jgi:ABC-2 type transport system permease protein